MAILLHEYRNQHAQRRYPFADTATLTSEAGSVLPVDFFIDAFLYPIDLQAGVYVSELNTAERTITLSDSFDDTPCGTAHWAEDDTTITVIDTSGFERAIGTFVLGAGAKTFEAENPMLFDASGLPLNPTCFIPLNQNGVRGIVTNDEQLSTGAVRIIGKNGVAVTTYVSGSKSIIRIDILGRPPPELIDCKDDCTPIEQIRIENIDCPPIIGAHGGNGVLTINSVGFDLNNLCPPKNIPDDEGNVTTDACAPPPPPPRPWPCPPNSYDVVPVVAGRIEIATPSTLAADNPVHVKAEPGIVAPIDLPHVIDAGNTTKIARRLNQFLRAGIKPGGRITLGLKANK